MDGHELLHMLTHVLIDTVKIFPILYLVYLLLEWLQKKFSPDVLVSEKHRKSVPFFGALSGLLPQCGFSAAAAALFNGGIIGGGTLLAVFLSTSDEAFPLMLAHPDRYIDMLALMGCKLVFGVLLGYLFTYTVFRRHPYGDPAALEHYAEHAEACCDHDHDHSHEHHHTLECEVEAAVESGEPCHLEEEPEGKPVHSCGCGCCQSQNIFLSALIHALKISGFLLLSLLIVHGVEFFVGEENFNAFLQSGGIFQPDFAALFGLIPGCGTSVFITELYLAGHLTFGSSLAGLCTGAGFGIPILLSSKKRRKEGMIVLLCLTVSAMVIGMLTDLVIGLF